MSINLSRSPFYYKLQPSTTTTPITRGVTQVFIWDGDITAQPTMPTYTLNKTVIGDDQFIVIEVSKLVNDFISIVYSGNYSSTDIQNYYLSTSTIFFDSTNTQVGTSIDTGAVLFSDGYSYFNQGANQTIGIGYGSDNEEICVPLNEQIYVPLYNGEAGNAVQVKFFTGTEAEAIAGQQQLGQTQELLNDTESDQNMAYFSPNPNGGLVRNNLNEQEYNNLVNSITGAQTTEIDDNNYPFCPDYNFIITYIKVITNRNGNIFKKLIKVNTKRKDKFDPIKIVFVNRFGMYEDLWCFGNNQKSFAVTTDQFKRNLLDRSTISYNADAHQYKTFSDQGKEKIRISTGYLPEQTNVVIKQLMLSQQIWIVQNGVIEPVNLANKNIVFKTHLTEKLIDYQFEFEYAYDTINKVV
jgi:hypothetical protein|tara:strand:+ start:25 stop:1254 length:1230 start_codon:yes stop_codon:yes gene_type:complete